MIERPSDAAIAACVAPTLRVLHAAPDGEWSRGVLAQLIGVVEYGRDRGADRTAERRGRLAAALDALAGNGLVPADGSPEARASAALEAAVGRDDEHADAVRATLRPVLVAELDDELVETMPLMDGFRGRVRHA
jgi:hypothetical protein